jgi:hypothetical protein
VNCNSSLTLVLKPDDEMQYNIAIKVVLKAFFLWFFQSSSSWGDCTFYLQEKEDGKKKRFVLVRISRTCDFYITLHQFEYFTAIFEDWELGILCFPYQTCLSSFLSPKIPVKER